MKKILTHLKNIAITLSILGLSFAFSLLAEYFYDTRTFIPTLFVLAVLLTSFLTEGYIYGIVSALAGTLAVHYAFTFPFFKFDFTLPENIVSAVIMITVSLLTGTLTARIKRWEALRAESERERMRANLLRAISHDLRTPLTTIYGSSSALLENSEHLTEEQKKNMLRGICEDSQWLVRMVENLLSITRLDGGNVKIIKTPAVLEELVDSVLLKIRKRYPKSTVQLDIPEELMMIPMDAILIEQVLVNLLENAILHAEGMSTLCLRVFPLGGKVIFEVIDDGCGIEEERLPQIFSGDYGKTHASDSQKNNAGIGLSVCAAIIRAHGGSIRAQNKKPHGMIFRFSLDTEETNDEH